MKKEYSEQKKTWFKEVACIGYYLDPVVAKLAYRNERLPPLSIF
jgi:hypothetical protein